MRDPSDRRRHIVKLTPSGRKALERAERAQESIEEEVLAALSPQETETLRELLARALAASDHPAGDGYPASADAESGPDAADSTRAEPVSRAR